MRLCRMADDLDKKIVQQLEYYFGDINLPRDKFMQEKIKEDDGWITLEILLTFNRLANLSKDPEVIVNAIKKSESVLLKVSEDGKKLRRNPDVPLPELNEERRKELNTRTAYAKGFPTDEKLDDIITFLEPYGPIDSCTKRIKLDLATKQHHFKGSCFIIFKDIETCKKFIELESVKYKDVELIRKWKNDYIEEKKKQIQDKKEARKNKKKKEPAVEEKKITFPKGTVLHFSGIKEDQTVTREEIKEKIKEVSEIVVSFVDYSKGDIEGFIRLPKENNATEVFSKLKDGELEIGEIKLKFRVVEGEEEEEFLKKSSDSISKNRQKKNHFKGKGKKRRGNFGEAGQQKKIKG